ncbi:MAG: DnaJ domain-containing protein [Myxococcota bacterium]
MSSQPHAEKEKVPRLRPEFDPKALPLGPVEGFVVSRIDGQASVEEIAQGTALSEMRVREVMHLLTQHDALEWVDPSEPSPRRTPSRVSMSSAAGQIHTKPAPPGTSRVLYDPQELEEPGVEIDVDARRRILDTFYRMDDLNFYELLGVDPDATKTEIRKGYFELSKVFHPDTKFGKELGSYKQKMEAVFKRLTEAYDILGKKRTRLEYDNYMQLRRKTRAAHDQVEKIDREAERIEKAAQRVAEQAVVHPSTERRPSTPPQGVERPSDTSPDGEASSSPPESTSGDAPPVESEPPRERSEEDKRRTRELVRRKLEAATGRFPARRRRRVSSKPPAEEPAPQSRDALLRGLAGSLRQAAAHTGGVDRSVIHIEEARDAEEAGNLVSAVNSLRLAVAMTQEREDVVAEYERVRQLYAASMAESYEKQAEYETRLGNWNDAAVSWSRVCEGRPTSGIAHVQAAVTLLEAGGDIGQARQYALRAVELLPDHVLAHRALGRVYAAAGMKLNAKRELEKVLKLDPSDEFVRTLLKEL